MMSRVPMGSDGAAIAVDPSLALKTYFVPQGISADIIATEFGFSRDDSTPRRREPEARRRRLGRGPLRPLGRAGHRRQRPADPRPRRAHAPRHRHAVARRAQARVQGHGRDHARLRRGGDPEISRTSSGSTTSTTPATRRGIVDGAAALLIGNRDFGVRHGLKPRARIKATAKIGTDPTIMLTGPVPVTEKILRERGMDDPRHRPLRGQRGLRRRRPALPAGLRRRPGPRQRQRRRHRHGPPARRHRRDDPRHRCSTSWSAATRKPPSPPSASAPAWARPRSSRGSEHGRHRPDHLPGEDRLDLPRALRLADGRALARCASARPPGSPSSAPTS